MVPKSPGTIKRDAINHGGESEKGGYLLPRALPCLRLPWPSYSAHSLFSILEDTSSGADEDKNDHGD